MKKFFVFVLLNALVFSILGSSEVVTVSYVKDKLYSLRNSYLLSEEKCVSSRIQNDECGVCGQDDYVTNSNKYSTQCSNEAIPHFFKDVLPKGSLITQVKVSVNGSFCGAKITLGLNSEVIGSFSSEEQCKCGASKSCEESSVIEFNSDYNVEDGGFPDYFYGVSNKLWIQAASGTIKLISATIELTYNTTSSMKQRATCPAIKSATQSCFISSEKADPSCFALSDLFTNSELIDSKKLKVQVVQCSSVDRDFCNEVKSTKTYKIDDKEICFNGYSCAGVSSKSPCVRFFDVKVSSNKCPSVTYTHGVPNKKESSAYGNNKNTELSKVKCVPKSSSPPKPSSTQVALTSFTFPDDQREFTGNAGFKFTVTKSSLVTELGQFCNKRNGVSPAKVAVWRVSDQQLLTSLEFNTVVCSANGYQYKALSVEKQITLTPGVEYLVTGFNDDDFGYTASTNSASDLKFNQDVTFIATLGNYDYETTFVYPDWVTSDSGEYFAMGNFKYVVDN